MANPEHLILLKQGVEQWNEWRTRHRGIELDLHDADLSNTDLSNIDLRYTNLLHTDLSNADLSNANLSHTDLIRARLSNANLSHADLCHANLVNADLISANLSGADFHDVRLGFTVFAWVDLRAVEGLDTITHEGPSIIDVQTVQLPERKIRTPFLRGVGFSDTFIDYYDSLFTMPIQYHSCFISYSSKDDALARRLHANLQAQGVRCWFAPEDMKIGERIRDRVDKAIRVQDKLLLLLSEHALESDWVEDEVEIAFRKEREQKRDVLFPVRLDESIMQASQSWAKKLRDTRHIGDFTNWTDPQAYQQAFDRLLRDLKRAGEAE